LDKGAEADQEEIDDGPGANVIKLHLPVMTDFSTKPECLKTRLEKLARDKHSDSLQKFINYGQKKFYKIGPNVIKLFTDVNYVFLQ
jgi:hypothetical protein